MVKLSLKLQPVRKFSLVLTVKAVKRNSWKSLSGEIDGIKPLTKLKLALAKDPFYPEMLIKEDSTYTDSNEEVLD